MPMTYSNYLKLDELLKLQKPVAEGEHDETLFIIIHQVYELWFKQILHETARLQSTLETGKTPQALSTFKRVLSILKTMVAQIDILETMTPLSFAGFRSRLETSSGFQSEQFRELELVLGKRSPRMLMHIPEGSPARKRLEARSKQRSLYDSFLTYLRLNGYTIPQGLLDRDCTEECVASPEVQSILIDVYKNNPSISQLCELFVDLDEGIQEWRYRHVKMVERTIGVKMGTGGSPGAEYLKSTLFKPLFPDLWAIRSSF